MISLSSIPWSGQLTANYLNGFQLRPNFEIVMPYVYSDSYVRQDFLTPESAPLLCKDAMSFFQEVLCQNRLLLPPNAEWSLVRYPTEEEPAFEAVSADRLRQVFMHGPEDDDDHLTVCVQRNHAASEVSFQFGFYLQEERLAPYGIIRIKLGPEAWKEGLLGYFGLRDAANSPDILSAIYGALASGGSRRDAEPQPQYSQDAWQIFTHPLGDTTEISLRTKPDLRLSLALAFDDFHNRRRSDAELFLSDLAFRLTAPQAGNSDGGSL